MWKSKVQVVTILLGWYRLEHFDQWSKVASVSCKFLSWYETTPDRNSCIQFCSAKAADSRRSTIWCICKSRWLRWFTAGWNSTGIMCSLPWITCTSWLSHICATSASGWWMTRWQWSGWTSGSHQLAIISCTALPATICCYRQLLLLASCSES